MGNIIEIFSYFVKSSLPELKIADLFSIYMSDIFDKPEFSFISNNKRFLILPKNRCGREGEASWGRS